MRKRQLHHSDGPSQRRHCRLYFMNRSTDPTYCITEMPKIRSIDLETPSWQHCLHTSPLNRGGCTPPQSAPNNRHRKDRNRRQTQAERLHIDAWDAIIHDAPARTRPPGGPFRPPLGG